MSIWAKEKRQAYYQENKSSIKQHSSEYYRANREKILADTRADYKINREKYISKSRDYHLRTKFGISLADYKAMVAARDGLCDICRGKSNGSGSLHVDHDHKTGELRGLLCSNCNLAIGLFSDSAERLLSAERYLRRLK